MLEFDHVSLHFGGLKALDDVAFRVLGGSICGLIGPNGAGKTSLFNCVSGLYRPSGGAILMAGADVLALPPHRVRELGIARTFQHVGAFPSLTVRENLALGGASRPGSRFWRSVRGGWGGTHEPVVDECLERLTLCEVAEVPAGALPYGTLKRVELARALASRPRLLLLDEPAAGLVQSEVDELATLLRQLRAELHLTVLVVEHHMGLVMGTCDTVAVLNFGAFVTQGTPAEVQSDERVVEAYLGAAA